MYCRQRIPSESRKGTNPVLNEAEPEQAPYFFRCPQCNQNEKFYTVKSDGELGRNLGLLSAGGLLVYFLFSRPVGPKCLCGRCGYVFPIPEQPKAFVTHMIVLGWFATALAGIASIAIYTAPDFWRLGYVATHWVVQSLSRICSAYPEATLLSSLSVPIISKLVCMYFNAKHRKVALAGYRTRPPEYQGQK